MTEPSPPTAHSLSEQLGEILTSSDGQDTTLGDFVDAIGERGFGLLLAILALPAALPIPAPGYATPFGLIMMGLAVQMIRGRTVPALPQRARRRTLSHSKLEWTFRNAKLPLRVVEFLVRPRLSRLASSRAVHRLVGVVVLLMACSMSLPIPLTNTAPSFVIFVLACGLIEEDGLLLLGGILLAPIAAGIAGIAIYLLATVGMGALEGGTRETLMDFFGR